MLQGDSNPDPQNQLELCVNVLIHWTTSNRIEIESFQLHFVHMFVCFVYTSEF